MALVNCNECKREVSDTAPRCPHCGYTSGQYAGKSKSLAIVFALFLGGLGIHKFYLGKSGTGFLYLIFCWTFIPVILGIIDAFVLMGKSERVFTGGVRPGIASDLTTNSAGDIKVFYKQPVFWVVIVAITLLALTLNFRGPMNLIPQRLLHNRPRHLDLQKKPQLKISVLSASTSRPTSL